MISHHFSQVHATFWLRMEQCSNRRRNLVPDEFGARFARPETNARERSQFMVPVSGLYNFCRGYYSCTELCRLIAASFVVFSQLELSVGVAMP